MKQVLNVPAALVSLAAAFLFPAAALAQAYIVSSPEILATGSCEVDLYSEIGIYDADGARTRSASQDVYVYYGVAPSFELILTAGRAFGREYPPGEGEGPRGITATSDSGVELKRNFYAKGRYQAAVSACLNLPTGDPDRDPGSGRRSHSFYLYTMRSGEKATCYFNFGLDRNLGGEGERKNLKSFTLCVDHKLYREKLGSRISLGAADDADPEARGRKNSFYAGISYAPAEWADIGVGYYRGLNYDERGVLFYTGFYRTF